MDEITKEMDAMAEKLSKSQEDPKETLFKTLTALGKDGIRARLSSLSTDEKSLLKAALEEMSLNKSKSIEFDKEAQGAKMIQGKVTDTIIQEEKGDDEADEKLVKPEAAKHNHQGNSVDGWEGQVIKAKEIPVEKKNMKSEEKQQMAEENEVGKYSEKKEKKSMKKSELIEQMNKSEDTLVKAIERMHEKGMRKKMIKKNLKSAGVDAEKVEKAMEKVKSKKDASKKIMEMEEKEHGTKDPKKLVEAEENEQKMKKAKILEEESQTNDTKQMTEESKDLGDHLNMGKDNKKVQDQVNNMKTEVKKSFSWTSEDALLKANTFGRNFHFNVGDFVEQEMAKAKKSKDEAETEEKKVKEEKEPKMKKSENLNDIIEKSQDESWFQSDLKKSLAEANDKRTASLVKSFDEVEDMASLLGISIDECKKILG